MGFQHHAKIQRKKIKTQFPENVRTDRRMDGRVDRPCFRTLPVIVPGPTKLKYWSNCLLHTYRVFNSLYSEYFINMLGMLTICDIFDIMCHTTGLTDKLRGSQRSDDLLVVLIARMQTRQNFFCVQLPTSRSSTRPASLHILVQVVP